MFCSVGCSYLIKNYIDTTILMTLKINELFVISEIINIFFSNHRQNEQSIYNDISKLITLIEIVNRS